MMTRTTTATAIAILALTSSVTGFAPSTASASRRATFLGASYIATPPPNTTSETSPMETGVTQDMTVQQSAQVEAPTVEKKAAPKKAPKKGGAVHKEGVFSPAVLAAKAVLGDERLNQVRGKVIGLHSDVIGNFVETAEWPTGQATLKVLFQVADKNKDGVISEDELMVAVSSLGFTWLQEKQVKGIFKRADQDENGAIDMEEFVKEAPKTLRTNLVKLAKKNGGDMGLLV